MDYDTGVATIAQDYQAQNWAKSQPPDKASDLNTAIGWLLASDLSTIPHEGVKVAAQQLRDGLESQEITRVDIFYVHNLAHSDYIDAQLDTVQRTTRRLLEHYRMDDSLPPDCLANQISRDMVEEWRELQHETISVHDEIILTSSFPPQELHSQEWHAAVATIPVCQLVDLMERYRDNLTSANVRDYLGSRKTARNINRQIARTAQEEPQNFWIYNNGITVLTNAITVEGTQLRLSGMAIINGAQTTGSLTEASAHGNLSGAEVSVRAIKCSSSDLVDSVIRYNNTQNPIKAWELRVIDPIQKRIKEDFEQLGIIYQLRRSAGRRRSTDVVYEKLGPYLSAFYGDPLAAHKNRTALFENESRYRELFDEQSNVKNLLFVYRLGSAVSRTKQQLKEETASENASVDSQTKYHYFRYGSFSYVVMLICSEVIGLWVKTRDVRYKKKVTLVSDILLEQSASEQLLSRLVMAVLGPVHAFFKEKEAYEYLKTQSGVGELANYVKTFIEQVYQMQPDTYSDFVDNLQLTDA